MLFFHLKLRAVDDYRYGAVVKEVYLHFGAEDTGLGLTAREAPYLFGEIFVEPFCLRGKLRTEEIGAVSVTAIGAKGEV